MEASKYQRGEMKLSFYACSPDEWHRVAQWVNTHGVVSDNVRWIVQIPRL